MVRNQTIEGTLEDLPEYARMALAFRGHLFTLVIRSNDQRLEVGVTRMGDALSVSAVFSQSEKEEQAMRGFFSRKGLQIPPDSEPTEPTDGFLFPEAPVQLIYPISPLPETVAGFSALVGDLFREVGGVVDNAPMSFHIEEASNAA